MYPELAAVLCVGRGQEWFQFRSTGSKRFEVMAHWKKPRLWVQIIPGCLLLSWSIHLAQVCLCWFGSSSPGSILGHLSQPNLEMLLGSESGIYCMQIPYITAKLYSLSTSHFKPNKILHRSTGEKRHTVLVAALADQQDLQPRVISFHLWTLALPLWQVTSLHSISYKRRWSCTRCLSSGARWRPRLSDMQVLGPGAWHLGSNSYFHWLRMQDESSLLDIVASKALLLLGARLLRQN